MRTGPRTALGAGGTAVLLAALAAASGPSLPYRIDDSARLRLSWSARPERIETCRTRSEAELADRPEHMRQRMECDGVAATYTLTITVDGSVIDSRVLRGGGFRHDRPIYLLDDVPVASGRHRLVVNLARREAAQSHDDNDHEEVESDADTGVFAGRAHREREERGRRQRAAVPASLRLDTTIVFRSREVLLVTFDAEHQRLTLPRGREP